MDHATEQSYYKRFRAAAIRFEVIGGALLAIGIGANFIFGTSMLAVSLIFAGPGALLLILGVCPAMHARTEPRNGPRPSGRAALVKKDPADGTLYPGGPSRG